ncbi:MAG TPA: Asp-tRNA(Asn)/Glu-tRNA(Gln) amidotransferase subunit GatB [Chitinophagaceae bacterium]|nr:Asp-tRNA(Asn)/Glu-tRNA(Gln) amidotransferase subunit GatB [Chitinophagaceae bacterium]
MINSDAYETVIGLEVHAQLRTESKLFCGDSTAFGAEPNTHVSAITLAHPGTLPKINRKAIEYAVKMGLACHCEIIKENYFARKNYLYPDLPKGYQVSQHTTPVCKGGFVKIETAAGEKKVKLNRIHLEEDAGKSIHDADEINSCIDYNRAGTALIEIVTEPDLRSSEEAYAYLAEIRKLVRYLSICDGNMEEGSLRCDANISVRKKGETKLGTRTEIKNLNSIRNVRRAIDAEAERLVEALENGEVITQQTRGFDANTGTTFATRDKEEADDYRYFPEPDLPPFDLTREFIEEVRRTIPALPAERVIKYSSAYELSSYDASLISEERTFADYFEEVVIHTNNYKAAANWMLGPVKTWLNEHNIAIVDYPLSAKQLAAIINLVDKGGISFSAASGKLLSLLLQEPGAEVQEMAEKNNLFQQSDVSAIGPIVDKVLEKFADKVTAYKKGKKGLLALFVGEVMKQSKGKADPKITNEILMEKLKS